MQTSTPNPTPETLDEVAPRLTHSMAEVVSRLERAGVTVETAETYLLDSAEHRIRVPCALDGFPVQISFSASIPAWSERVRAHLQVCFVPGRRWSVYEGPKGFQVSRIVARINEELGACRRERDKKLAVAEKRRLAEERLAALALRIGVPLHDPATLQQDNVEILALSETPSEVRVTVYTSHENAVKITKEFRKEGWRRRKA